MLAHVAPWFDKGFEGPWSLPLVVFLETLCAECVAQLQQGEGTPCDRNQAAADELVKWGWPCVRSLLRGWRGRVARRGLCTLGHLCWLDGRMQMRAAALGNYAMLLTDELDVLGIDNAILALKFILARELCPTPHAPLLAQASPGTRTPVLTTKILSQRYDSLDDVEDIMDANSAPPTRGYLETLLTTVLNFINPNNRETTVSCGPSSRSVAATPRPAAWRHVAI